MENTENESMSPFTGIETEEELMENILLPGEEEGKSGMLLSSTELAELYIKQGDYERGIDVYRQLLRVDPGNREVQGLLEEAESLANLLTLRGEQGEYDKGFEEGFQAATQKSTPGNSGQEEPDMGKEARIARLNNLLERIQDKK